MNQLKNQLILIVLFLCGCSQKPDKPAPSANSSIEKAFISFRIGVPQWYSPEAFNELLDMFDKYKGVTDEITLFTSGTHAPLPLDVIKDRTTVMKERLEQARKRGYKAGINILTTIGHHEENLDNSLKGNYTGMTNIDGQVCHGSFCPNDANVQEYVRAQYQLVAGANPDYIWIDDDVRYGHMPVGNGCFCDNCLKIFEKETGIKYTRESLKKALNEGPVEEKLKVRKAWLQHNRNTISNLFKLIEKTVHGINPTLPLGFMTGDRFIEGYDFDNWAKILSGPNHAPVMWRPGGGYYNDMNTTGLAGKSHDIGRQVSALPNDVVSIQSEIENFPYQNLKKADHIVALEACSHIAAGCTGTAFNVLSGYGLDEYESLIALLHQERPFFDLMAKTLGRSPLSGIQTFWNKDSYITGNLNDGNWTSSGNPFVSHEFYNIGLPICYSNKNQKVTILSEDNVYALSNDELQKILSGGVYMDAETLILLNKMGFSELTGFEPIQAEYKDRIERFSNHPFNGNYAGRERDNRQSFWKSPAWTLRKTSEKAQSLAGLTDYAGKNIADCTLGIFENKLGGRICVAGYYPFTFMESYTKSLQMKTVFRWLSNDKLPGYIASFNKINLWIREPQNGKTTMAFTNASFDPAKNLVLMLLATSETIKVYDMQCHETTIHSSGTDGPYRKFVVPEVAPWEIRLVSLP